MPYALRWGGRTKLQALDGLDFGYTVCTEWEEEVKLASGIGLDFGHTQISSLGRLTQRQHASKSHRRDCSGCPSERGQEVP